MKQFEIIYQFLKDISFESPNVPDLFFKKDGGESKIETEVYTQIKGADNNVFMVDLVIKLHSKLEKDSKSVFLIDSTYSALVKLTDDKSDDETKKRILLIDVPTMIFPVVRSLILNLTGESGFQPFFIPPFDFEKVYEEQQKNKK